MISYGTERISDQFYYTAMQKYEILGVIGEGAYGVVMKCKSNENKEIVAIKKFKQTQDDQIVRKTTMRQVKVLKMLKHPNIVQLKQAFRKKGIVYLVFEYVQNNLLEVLQKQPDGLEPETIKILTYNILKGLAYLHSQGIAHRDIKPQNLLVGARNELKICDFGFARQMRKQGEEQLTDYVATRWYRPPELLVGAKYGKQIDLWAVGCIFGELIDGNPMFPGQNQLDQLFLIQKCLGSLSPDQNQTFLKNPRYLGMKFPEINILETIQKRYLGKITSKALNFLKQLLRINPNDRLTAVDAIKHPYFDGIREEDFIRKLSSNNYMKNQSKIFQTNREDYPQSVNQDRKKYQTNPYNPPVHSNQLYNQRELTEEIFDPNFARNQKNTINNPKKIKQEISVKNPLITTASKGFNPPNLHSKSMNKSKVNSKIKQKNVSLQKHQHRETLAKTQTGFYILGGGIIQQRNEDEEGPQYTRNKIYNVKTPNIKQKNNRNNMVSEQVLEENDEEPQWQSNGQLPILMMASNHSNDKKIVQSPAINILITNSTFNHKNY